MADLTIRDRVRVIGLAEDDKTGVIVGEGEPHKVELGKVVPGQRLQPEMTILWWRVRLDGTGEKKDYPDDRLEKIEELD